MVKKVTFAEKGKSLSFGPSSRKCFLASGPAAAPRFHNPTAITRVFVETYLEALLIKNTILEAFGGLQLASTEARLTEARYAHSQKTSLRQQILNELFKIFYVGSMLSLLKTKQIDRS